MQVGTRKMTRTLSVRVLQSVSSKYYMEKQINNKDSLCPGKTGLDIPVTQLVNPFMSGDPQKAIWQTSDADQTPHNAALIRVSTVCKYFSNFFLYEYLNLTYLKVKVDSSNTSVGEFIQSKNWLMSRIVFLIMFAYFLCALKLHCVQYNRCCRMISTTVSRISISS